MAIIQEPEVVEKPRKDGAYIEFSFHFHGGKHFWRWIGIFAMVVSFTAIIVGKLLVLPIYLRFAHLDVKNFDDCTKAGYGILEGEPTICVSRYNGLFVPTGTYEKMQKNDSY